MNNIALEMHSVKFKNQQKNIYSIYLAHKYLLLIKFVKVSTEFFKITFSMQYVKHNNTFPQIYKQFWNYSKHCSWITSVKK